MKYDETLYVLGTNFIRSTIKYNIKYNINIYKYNINMKREYNSIS